jgi:hypothetical protein
MRTLKLLLLLLLAAPAADAAVIARVVTPAAAQPVGGSFTVELRADLGDPVLGWGLDLAYDPARIQLTEPPEIGLEWAAFAAPDGDGLAAVRLGDGLTGDDVLLATLHFQALAEGVAQLVLSATLADLSEGFALDPEGFASVTFQNGAVTIVPEPASGALLLSGLVGLVLYTNSRSRSDVRRR